MEDLTCCYAAVKAVGSSSATTQRCQLLQTLVTHMAMHFFIFLSSLHLQFIVAACSGGTADMGVEPVTGQILVAGSSSSSI